jgi:hypothetical protein
MRMLVVSTAAVVRSLMLLLALMGPFSTPGLSPHPAEAAAAVKVDVSCRSDPEKTRVENNTNHRITIRTVGSIYKPRSNEPFRVDVRLRPDSAITFESGSDANRHVLTHLFIYNNDVGSKEGARVRTSEGRFIDRCYRSLRSSKVRWPGLE